MKTRNLRLWISRQHGVSSVETAFLMPVVLVSLMLLFEIAHMMLVIIIGNLALDSALKNVRDAEGISLGSSQYLSDAIISNMRQEGFGYLNKVQLTPEVMVYENLDMMSSDGGDEDNDSSDDDSSGASTMPLVVAVSVESKVPFITPLPALLMMSNQFGYRFHQITGTLYQSESEQ